MHQKDARGFILSVSDLVLERGESFLNLLGFMQRTETPRTDFYLYWLTVSNQCLLVHVSRELGLSMSV